MAEKVYMELNQLLTTLSSRGMVIKKGHQSARVLHTLEMENYYNVINGYKELFISSPATATDDEVYKAGTTFDEVYSLYSFDRDLRNIYLRYLLKIENSIKSVISHEFSKLYGHKNFLRTENFDSADTAGVIKLIGDIHQEIARQMGKKHQVITHYMTEHGYIPLWVLVNVLTFGKITMFYTYMKETDRITVAHKFHVAPDELRKYMVILGLGGKKCAHDERFYDFRSRNNIHTKSIKNFGVLALPKDAAGNYEYGLNDCFSVAIIISRLLSRADTKELVREMSALFAKLDKSLHTICIDDVMRIMGYPKSWANLTSL